MREAHSVCQHCMGAHAGHQVIQVRRYVYCDVVRACDINPFVDTAGVQNYIINSAKVMFLHHRPQSKLGRPNGPDVCATCTRHLREGYTYCSIACKVEALTKGEAGAGSAGTAPRRASSVAAAAASVAPPGGRQLSVPVVVAAAAAGPMRSSYLTPQCLQQPTSLPKDRLLAAAAAAAKALAAAKAAASAEADADVDGTDSSEPGEETVSYGIKYGAAAALVSPFGRKRVAPHAGGGGGGGAGSEGCEPERDASSGSASSEDERFELQFENAPKRPRSLPAGRRPVVTATISRRGSHDSAADYAPGYGSGYAPTTAAPPDVAEAAALLMPFRSGSIGRNAMAAVDAAAAGVVGFGGGVVGSRRKQSLPQKAPAC